LEGLRVAGITVFVGLQCLGGAGCSALSQKNSVNGLGDELARSTVLMVEKNRYSDKEIEQLKRVLPYYEVLADPNSRLRPRYDAIVALGEINREGIGGNGPAFNQTAALLRTIIHSPNASEFLKEEAQQSLYKMGFDQAVNRETVITDQEDFDWQKAFVYAVALIARIFATTDNYEGDVLPGGVERDPESYDDPAASPTLEISPGGMDMNKIGLSRDGTGTADSHFKLRFQPETGLMCLI
jgi:hypothetical protein